MKSDIGLYRLLSISSIAARHVEQCGLKAGKHLGCSVLRGERRRLRLNDATHREQLPQECRPAHHALAPAKKVRVQEIPVMPFSHERPELWPRAHQALCAQQLQ